MGITVRIQDSMSMTEPCGGAPDVLHHVEGITARRAAAHRHHFRVQRAQLAAWREISRSTVEAFVPDYF